MATPRIFISSTCYDLQELRFQLRKFISDIGYEPVMSEFGDIFYDLKDHVQDGCKNEIERCEMFVLIIGNNYGSIYHKHAEGVSLPDSITLQEFRKALEVNVPKYIFINRFVQHDYENYRKTLSKKIEEYFSKNEVRDDEIKSTKSKIKAEFDENYPFPQDTYKYVFYFIEIIYHLDVNNAVFSFESFDDIRENLKKQWAGFFYEQLTKDNTVPLEKVLGIETKIDRIENQLRLIAKSGTKGDEENKLTIDISKLASDINIKDLVNFQDHIHSLLMKILYDSFNKQRIEFSQRWNEKAVLKLLGKLDILVKDFKWSRNIPIPKIFGGVRYSFWKARADVPYEALLELNGIANRFEGEDKDSLINTIILELDKLYVEPPPPSSEPFGGEAADDIPF